MFVREIENKLNLGIVIISYYPLRYPVGAQKVLNKCNMNLKFFKVNLENLAVLFTPHLGNNGHFKNEKKMVQIFFFLHIIFLCSDLLKSQAI